MADAAHSGIVQASSRTIRMRAATVMSGGINGMPALCAPGHPVEDGKTPMSNALLNELQEVPMGASKHSAFPWRQAYPHRRCRRAAAPAGTLGAREKPE